MPGWDNTARRQDNPTIVVNASPYLYEKWLNYLRGYIRSQNLTQDKKLIFVNAWNEWGEGCHLEPDLENGLALLEATFRSQYYTPSEQNGPDLEKLKEDLK